MPFRPPFRESFFIGDLIYGLNEQRTKYIENYSHFAIC